MQAQKVTFSTERRNDTVEDAFAAYHDLYAPVADAERLAGRFSASVTAYRLGGLLVFDRRLRSVAHVRSPRRVARNAFDHFTVQLATRGSFLIATDAGERRVTPGALALVDMTRAMRTEAPAADLLTLSVPRERLDEVAGEAGRLHGAVLPASRAGLLRDFILSALRNDQALRPADGHRVERVITELLGVALSGQDLDHRSLPRSAGDVLCRARAKHFIDANLACTAEEVATATGHSRSVLYRAFQPLGGLATYIQSRRILRLRDLLNAPDESRQVSELAFACGFANASHAARAFRAAFDLTPRDYRAARVAGLGEGPQGEAHRVLARWWGELR